MTEEHQQEVTHEPQVRVGVGVMLLTPGGYVLMQRQGSHGEGEFRCNTF